MAEILNLSVRKFNMYRTGKVYNFPEQGEKMLERGDLIYNPSVLDKTHTVKDNETIWNIAYEEYQNQVLNPSRYWWVIARVNDIFDPFDLSAFQGKEIIIPSLSNIDLVN
jgi:nucleoid-associated protein YgaU|tara:strand:- start:3431 stop:3760 length:330 start_codon:yes stop_codon:yes gene_type:complete